MKVIKTLCAALGLLCIATPSAASAAELQWFSRASSLEPGQYWRVQEFGEGPVTLDLSVVRWDEGDKEWTGCREGTKCTSNSDVLSWGVPVYSPVDGKVRACWRTGKDNSKGTKLSAVQGQSEQWTIPMSGNSLFIETPDGDLIKLTHLQEGSIPTALCPKQGGEFNTDAGRAKTPSGDYRVGMYLEPADRPSIKKGQLVGRVGNSGNSGGPHLHLDRATIDSPSSTGVKVPLRFTRIWAQEWEKDRQATAGRWYRFRGEELQGYDPAQEPPKPADGEPDLRCGSSTYQAYEPRCRYTMFHGSPFLQRVVNGNLSTSEDTAVTFLSESVVVTANKTAKDTLFLTTWRVDGVTQLTKLDTELAGTVKQLAIAKVSSGRVLVALKLGSDQLKLILYRVDAQGQLTRLDDYLSNEIRGVQFTRIDGGDDKFATAIVGNDSRLKIIVWDVNNDKIVREGSATGPLVSETRIAAAKSFRGVVTASRDSQQRLVLNTFTVSADGAVVTKVAEKTRSSVGEALSVTATPGAVVTAFQRANGTMGIESHQLNGAANIGRMKGSESAGSISEVKLLNPALAGGNIAAVVRDGAGKLRIIGWTLRPDGGALRRDGSSRYVDASYIDAATITKRYDGKSSRDLIVVSSRGPMGMFYLSTWDTNLND